MGRRWEQEFSDWLENNIVEAGNKDRHGSVSWDHPDSYDSQRRWAEDRLPYDKITRLVYRKDVQNAVNCIRHIISHRLRSTQNVILQTENLAKADSFTSCG